MLALRNLQLLKQARNLRCKDYSLQSSPGQSTTTSAGVGIQLPVSVLDLDAHNHNSSHISKTKEEHKKQRIIDVFQQGNVNEEKLVVQKTLNLGQIKLVPLSLHVHLFGEQEISEDQKKRMQSEGCAELLVELPELRARGDLMKHFELEAKEQFKEYHDCLETALEMREVPPRPKQWALVPGWTSYGDGQNKSVPFPDEPLLFFDVEVCVLDGKLPTMAVALSPRKWYSWCSERLATIEVPVPELVRPQHLIPLDSEFGFRQKRLVIGHHVAFDRSFVREPYFQESSEIRFWDTMSMHIAVAGMADHQRILYDDKDPAARFFRYSNKQPGKRQIVDESTIPYHLTPAFKKVVEKWKLRTCKNSLDAIHKRYCADNAQVRLDKTMQNFFTKASISEIRERAQELFDYCATDVQATFEVFSKLYPKFKQRFPHPVTHCGMLEMGNSYLPITGNWRRFFAHCDELSAHCKDNITRQFVKRARELRDELEAEDANGLRKWQSDPWMWLAEWNWPAKRAEWPQWYWDLFKKLADAKIPLGELSAESVKLLSRNIPRIFGLCYGPYPLFHKMEFGWGFLVPGKRATRTAVAAAETKVQLRSGEMAHFPAGAIHDFIRRQSMHESDLLHCKFIPVSEVGPFDFYRLPHASGTARNVGTPFDKSNKANFEQGVLRATRYSEELMQLLDSRAITRFWGNYRNRYQEELPVWLDAEGEHGAIVPSIIAAGTVTRRATHKLWLTSTNPKKEVIGSDMKSMVQCPKGWNLVGADVDSQEQWLAAMFGDSIHAAKSAGATPFSRMLLAGDKAHQTDLHSVVAKEVGISRDQAKTLNYARLYGSGQLHAEQFLQMQGISEQRATNLARALFEKTRGQTGWYFQLSHVGNSLFKQYCDDAWGIERFLNFQIATNQQPIKPFLYLNGRYFIWRSKWQKGPNYGLSDHFEHWIKANLSKELKSANLIRQYLYGEPDKVALFSGGYESFTFNFLALNATEMNPRTPILKCQLSEALEPMRREKDGLFRQAEVDKFNALFKRTIINWFVQSSAVDFLHILMVCMRWLCRKYDIPARFVISIHDEVRYMVPKEDRYRCALALCLSNMYVRAAISESLGIRELPRSVAFFSQVDIDTVLRKEVSMECRTPDGKTVPKGEAVTIDQIIAQTNGSLARKKNSI